jgi:phage tail protein X
MIYTATQGDTWDSIAFKTVGDEFQFEALIKSNYELSEIVQFLGGEKVNIPDSVINTYTMNGVNSSTTKVRVIEAPWG